MNLRSCPYIALSIFIASQGMAYADLDSPASLFNLKSRSDQLESEIEAVEVKTIFNNVGAKTASAAPQIDGYNFYFTADFIWWKLYEGGTDWIMQDETSGGTLNASINHLRFAWEPGFKVGIGNIFKNGWDLNIEFTNIQFNAHNNKESDDDVTYQALFGIQGLDVGGPANARWHTTFSDLDIVLGRNYFISKYLSLNPFMGITTAWINQKRRARYEMADGTNIELVHSKNNFSGVGPRIGIDTQFFFNKNFSLYGNIAGALLWGMFEVEEKSNFLVTKTQVYNLNSNCHKMAPTVGIGMGAAWEANLVRNCLHFLVSLGYESQYWWKQNQMSTFYLSSLSFDRVDEDLSTQGLTLKFLLDF